MRRGYIGQANNREQAYKTLLLHETDSFHTELPDLLDSLKPNDEIIIEDITDLNVSMRKLVAETSHLRGQNISIQVINYFTLELDTYLDVIESAIEMEQEWLAIRTKEGLERAKEKGNVVGRPKLTNEKINEIKYWYGQHLSLRSISEKADVSLGTVHKYVSHFKEEEKTGNS